MATFTAYRAINIANLDFNDLSEYDIEFLNNVFQSYRGRVFEDVITILDDVDGETSFGGRGLNATGTTGTVTGVADFSLNGSVRFELLDFEIAANTVRLAIESKSRNDDKKVLAEIFGDDDVFNLSSGRDTARGYDGNDVLNGRKGNDRLSGDDGNDTLNGGEGRDRLTGGRGDDVFVFDTALRKSNVDTVTDFNVADDTIQLDNTIFKAISNGNLPGVRFVANNSGNAQDRADRIVYEKDTGKLFYDRDGTGGTHKKVHFATLDDGLSLTHTDFFIL
jgi:Ca2+-binding RTX toxin-like protein